MAGQSISHPGCSPEASPCSSQGAPCILQEQSVSIVKKIKNWLVCRLPNQEHPAAPSVQRGAPKLPGWEGFEEPGLEKGDPAHGGNWVIPPTQSFPESCGKHLRSIPDWTKGAQEGRALSPLKKREASSLIFFSLQFYLQNVLKLFVQHLIKMRLSNWCPHMQFMLLQPLVCLAIFLLTQVQFQRPKIGT